MPEDLEQLKKAYGEATRGLLEAGEKLTDERKKTAELNTRSTELETRAKAAEGKVEDLSKEVRTAQETVTKISKEHDEILVRLQSPGLLPGGDAKDIAGQKAAERSYSRMLRNLAHGDLGKDMTPEEKEFLVTIPEARQKRALFVSQDELGGFLVAPVVSARMVAKLVQVSPIRQFATVMGIGTAQSLKFTREVGTLSAGWSHERGTRTETTGEQFKGIEIFTHEQYALVRLGYQLIEDGMFPIEAFIEGRITRQFARVEGLAFVSGNGVGQPEGLLTNPEIEVVSAAAGSPSGGFIPDDVQDFFAELKTEYAANATFLAHRKTVANMRKFKDAVNRWLDLVERTALKNIGSLSVDGYPAAEVPDLATWGTSVAKLCIFGDIEEAYTIVDRSLMSIIRDPYSRKTSGEVEIQYMRRLGGKVVQPDAVKILQGAA